MRKQLMSALRGLLGRDTPFNPDSHICQVSLSTLTDAVLILEGLAELLDSTLEVSAHPHPEDAPGHRRDAAYPAATTSYIRATAAALAAGNHHPHLTHARQQPHRDWAGELSQLAD